MPDSLFFNGAGDDLITLSLGNASSSGAYTVVVIAKWGSDSATYKDFLTWTAGSTQASLGTSNAVPHILSAYGGSGAGVAESTFTTPSSDGWCVYAYNRASGSTGRFHKYVYDTDTWTHEANGATISGDAATGWFIGAGGGPAQYFNGNMLIAGWWNSELADGTIETLAESMQAWVDADPDEAWRLDTLDPIASFATDGAADETARAGTTLDTGDAPAGWADLEAGTTPLLIRPTTAGRW